MRAVNPVRPQPGGPLPSVGFVVGHSREPQAAAWRLFHSAASGKGGRSFVGEKEKPCEFHRAFVYLSFVRISRQISWLSHFY
jgi:hypothetical protein